MGTTSPSVVVWLLLGVAVIVAMYYFGEWWSKNTIEVRPPVQPSPRPAPAPQRPPALPPSLPPVAATFPREQALAALLRDATAHGEARRWDEAILALQRAQALMLVSDLAFPAATWCRLPLYLQRAGRFEESMQAFDSLLADLPRRARRDAQLDNPIPGYEEQAQRRYERLLVDDAKFICAKRLLAESRQAKKAKL